jgi:Holliday junction resolvase RusA-like endonuclease
MVLFMSAQPTIEQSAPHTVTFTLPMCPPSVNSLYVIHYKATNPSDRVKLRPECQRWKSDAKVYIPRFKIAEDSILCVDWTVYYPWFTKMKTWAKRDTGNMLKLLHDMISEKIGVDDRRFKCGMMQSVNSAVEQTTVVLTEIPIATWSATNA